MDNSENQTNTEVNTNATSVVNMADSKVSKKNICGLLGFIGYFTIFLFCFVLMIAEASEDATIFLFCFVLMIAEASEDAIILIALLAIASLVLSIIGFVLRKRYSLLGITIAGFALNVNIIVLILVYMMLAIRS